MFKDQGRHGEFEPGNAHYSTPSFFDQLFLIRAYWNPKSKQGPGLGGLASRGGPDIKVHSERIPTHCLQSHVEIVSRKSFLSVADRKQFVTLWKQN